MTATVPGVSTDEFPIEFAKPEDADKSWTRERLHCPDQLSPLAYGVIAHCFGPGANAAMAAFHAPIASWEFGRFNTYAYAAITPVTGTPEEMAAMGTAAGAALEEGMARIKTAWEDEYFPEVRRYLEHWEAFDLSGAPMDALLRHLDDTLAHFTRLWDIHFLAIIPAYLALSELDEFFRDMFEGLGAFDGYKLIQGYPNMTVEVGHELWRLSRAALASPEVSDVITKDPRRPAAEVMADLETTGPGQEFLTAFRTYLDIYGQRGDLFFDVDRPAWVEDPTPVFHSLRSYMSQPDSADPVLMAESLAAEREAAIADARARMAGYPAPVRERFEFLLEAAAVGVVLTEDHGFWIDFRSSYKVREVLVEFGRRLTAGNEIAERDDVFMLTLDEMRESAVAAAIGAPCRSGGEPARAALVARRRAEMERFATVRAPDHIGAPPGPPPADDNPFARFMVKFGGAPIEPGAGDEPNMVRGNPGGPGRVRGVARVIRSITEADRLAPGEILVAETTTPPWTPLFAIAAAVVTDTGGVLSHCAVVAREYGLPAVVGTGRGTDRITDGMVIEVDGDNGVVLLSDDASA